MPEPVQSILAWVATIGITASVAATAAFWLFKLLADKWLASRFNQQLEAYKHFQQKELESLRLDISTQLDRVTKLHNYEFEVLPALWNKLNDAFSKTSHFISPLQTYPDLNRMTLPHLQEFLGKSELEGWQRDEIADEVDKTTAYQKAIFWHRLHAVKTSLADFHNYFVARGVFIQSDLKLQLFDMSKLLQDAVFEQEHEHAYPAPRAGRYKDSEKARKEGPDLLKKIEATVYARLWRETKIDS